MILFHYTNADGYNGIIRDGHIKASRGMGTSGMKDRVGVYLTNLNPDDQDKDFIAQKLYRVGGPSNVKQGKLDHHVQFDIPLPLVTQIREHVFCYDGGCLHLNEHNHNGGKNKHWTGLDVAILTASAGAVAAMGGAAMLFEGAKYAWDAWNAYAEKRKEEEKRIRDERRFNLECVIKSTNKEISQQMFVVKCKDGIQAHAYCTRCDTIMATIDLTREVPIDWKETIKSELNWHATMHIWGATFVASGSTVAVLLLAWWLRK